MTNANSRFLEIRCSWAKFLKRSIASWKEPAVRTWSQVRVVKLAVKVNMSAGLGVHVVSKRLTAQRRDGRVDWLDEDALAVELQVSSAPCWGNVWCCNVFTSSQDFASSRIHPSSITSAESLVTYTPCSSQVVATCMTRYLSRFGAAGPGVGCWLWLPMLKSGWTRLGLALVPEVHDDEGVASVDNWLVVRRGGRSDGRRRTFIGRSGRRRAGECEAAA